MVIKQSMVFALISNSYSFENNIFGGCAVCSGKLIVYAVCCSLICWSNEWFLELNEGICNA